VSTPVSAGRAGSQRRLAKRDAGRHTGRP
jgi:hypothetical protein